MAEKSYKAIEVERKYLEDRLNTLIKNIGDIPIANTRIMPYGWRKAAKGRTVWRIVEEVISQGLESQATALGFDSVHPADSEVGVYDFRFCYTCLASPPSSSTQVSCFFRVYKTLLSGITKNCPGISGQA